VAPVFLGVVARAIALPSETAVIPLAVYAGTVAVLMAATPSVATGVGLISNANRVMAHAGTLKRLAGGRSDDRRGRRTAVPLARRLLIARGR